MTRTPYSEKENSHHSKHHKHRSRRRSRAPLAPLNEDLSTEERLRQATEALTHERRKRRKAERRARAAQSATSAAADDTSNEVADGSVRRPKCASKVKMGDIRSHLGYDKPKWNAYRLAIHGALNAARLDWASDWRSQNPIRLSRAFNTVKDEFPEAQRFQGLWGIDRVAKQYWDNRTSYQRDIKNPESYRTRHAADCRRSGRGRRNHSPSPVASTSSAPPRRPYPRRIQSTDDENEETGGGNPEDAVFGSEEQEEDGEGSDQY
ncbi:hypothetical protein GGX14DRAFT_396016 [Mycena pura]|uniref:Uncharacterized protein n=1 Tax=Mycena pura TaxID=153505 RepID=A0AAD6YC43_9AGAR|nr:hypothetical protein GGX14DRAFT_396016 [Mycena pura]